MEFGLLGLLEVVDGGEPIVVGRGKESGLFAILLLHANEPVSTDRLIGALWGERPPENAAKNVQQYVSRLRRSLGADRLRTTPGGYLVRVGPDELDSDRFEQLASDGRRALDAGDAASADRLFASALALWRGPALADFQYDDFSQEAIRRLERGRRDVRADRIDARLALGEAGRVLPELYDLVEQEPQWERPRGQLMLALYRVGRQSDALEVYRETRGLLDDELGLAPSRELQELERAILNQDPGLRGRTGWQAVLRRRRSGALLLVVGGCLIAVAAAVVGLVELTGGLAQPRSGNEVVALDASSGRSVSYTGVGAAPGNIVSGAEGIWVLNADDRTITRIDPATRKVLKTFATSGVPTDLAAGDGALWVGSGVAVVRGLVTNSGQTVAVARIDPATTIVTKTAHLSGSASLDGDTGPTFGVSAIAVAPGAVWVVDPDGSISRIDPQSGSVVARVEPGRATAIAAGNAGVWFVTTSHGTPAVARIDPRTNTVEQIIPVQTSTLIGIAVGAGSVWATDPYNGVIWRIHPGANPVSRTISAGLGVTQIVFGDGVVWTANLANGTISRVDPRTNAITVTRQLAGTPQGLTVFEGTVWVSVADATSSGALPTRDCGPVESGGLKPDVLIASDLPLQGPSVTPTFAAAVRFVLRTHSYRAGRYVVGYQSCDDSTARSQGSDFMRCASNARDFGATAKVVAVIGPYDSDCAAIEIPVTNRTRSGALALVSPSTTYPGFTRTEPFDQPGEPGIFYPTGVKNYFRLTSADDLEGAGDAVLAKQLGLRRVYLLSDGALYGADLTRGFRAAARKLGINIVGLTNWNPAARNEAALVARIALARADGVLVAGFNTEAGELLRELRGRLGTRFPIMAGDGFLPIPYTLKAAGPAAQGVYVNLEGVVDQSLTPVGRRLLSRRSRRPNRRAHRCRARTCQDTSRPPRSSSTQSPTPTELEHQSYRNSAGQTSAMAFSAASTFRAAATSRPRPWRSRGSPAAGALRPHPGAPGRCHRPNRSRTGQPDRERRKPLTISLLRRLLHWREGTRLRRGGRTERLRRSEWWR